MTSAIEFRNVIYGYGNRNAGLAGRLLDLAGARGHVRAKAERKAQSFVFQREIINVAEVAPIPKIIKCPRLIFLRSTIYIEA